MSDSNDIDWFLQQVEREQSRLRAFVRSLGVRAEAVDDLAQDTLIVAYEKRASFDHSADFGRWIRGIARKMVANSIRKDARRSKILSDPVSEILIQATTPDVHPLELLMPNKRDHSLSALADCLASLPERSKQLIHLRYFERQSPGAIAGQLERSSNDIRQALFRLRRALLKCIEERIAHVIR